MILRRMILSILNALALFTIGLFGFFKWDTLGPHGTTPNGIPTEMLMPVFFGGALMICLGFTRMSYRHGLYGGLIIAILGITSALIRLNDYGFLSLFNQPKSQIIAAMAFLCHLQLFISWHSVKKDREFSPID